MSHSLAFFFFFFFFFHFPGKYFYPGKAGFIQLPGVPPCVDTQAMTGMTLCPEQHEGLSDLQGSPQDLCNLPASCLTSQPQQLARPSDARSPLVSAGDITWRNKVIFNSHLQELLRVRREPPPPLPVHTEPKRLASGSGSLFLTSLRGNPRTSAAALNAFSTATLWHLIPFPGHTSWFQVDPHWFRIDCDNYFS